MTTLMTGFPPAPPDQVTLANWRTPPFNRWAFHHVREIVPSADIAHDPASALAAPVAAIDTGALRIPRPNGPGLSLDDVMRTASTDGLVVLHRGRVVIERYPGMAADAPHILM